MSTDKLAINWQNFNRVQLLLKFAFIIRPLEELAFIASLLGIQHQKDSVELCYFLLASLLVVSLQRAFNGIAYTFEWLDW